MGRKELRLVAIDLDGTLVDSAPDLTFAVNAALDSLSLPTADEADVRQWVGDGVEMLVRRALEAQGGEAGAQMTPALRCFNETYLRHLFDRSRLYDGVPQALGLLRDRGLALACVTNKREAFAREVLEKAGIASFFPMVIGGDTLPVKKPDPQMLLFAGTKLSIAPEQSAMVGDSTHDLEAARGAGFAFYWASYGYRPGLGDAADEFQRMDSFAELPDLLAA